MKDTATDVRPNIERRQLLRRGVAAGAVAWAAPTIMTVAATSAAAASTAPAACTFRLDGFKVSYQTIVDGKLEVRELELVPPLDFQSSDKACCELATKAASYTADLRDLVFNGNLSKWPAAAAYLSARDALSASGC